MPKQPALTFDSLDPNHVVPQVLHYLSDHFEAKNWLCVFPVEQFSESPILNNNETVHVPGFHSLLPIEGDPLRELFHAFIMAKFSTPIFRQYKGDIWGMVPFFDPRSKTVTGYIIAQGFDISAMGELRKCVRDMLDEAGLHLAFCHDFWKAQSKNFVDDVTDLFNQRYLPIVLDNEISRGQRMKRNFAILFMDLDHFKKVNDTKGHLVGTQLLRQMGKELRKMIRAHDFAFRYGGDEFVLVLTDANAQVATQVAERIRKSIEQMTFQIDSTTLNVTVSIGIAVFPDHAQSAEKILKMADQAMYYAKHKSRNYVFVAS